MCSVMTQMCLSYWCTGCIGLIYSVRCRWNDGWDGTILDINATSAHLGSKCLQLLGMHALSGCDETSYPYGKGKISALNTLLSGDFPGLADVLGEVDTPLASLMDGAKPLLVLCMVSSRKHLWSLLAPHSSQGKPKSWPYLQHH